MKKKQKIFIIAIVGAFLVCIGVFGFKQNSNSINETTLATAASGLSNSKIGWGIKREKNHIQPDLGSKNKELIEQYKGIAMGNSEKKYVYLTFDEGYEAGYTPRILQVLKENDVKATFFITAHYVNTRRRTGKKYDR